MHGDLPELLILRHGETEWNRAGRWQGDLDSPLTDLGRDQARRMGRLLRDLGVTSETHGLYTSPLGRARDTARLVLAEIGAGDMPLIEDARLREISVGEWTGLTRAEILTRSDLHPEAHFLDFYRAAPLGESFDQIAARCAGVLAGLTRPAIIVTHGVTSLVLRCLALGWSLDRLSELPGGQGVVHRIASGWHEELAP